MEQIVRETASSDGTAELVLEGRTGLVNPTLTIGVDVSDALPLVANSDIASMGPALGSRGFVVSHERMQELITCDGNELSKFIHPLRNGRDLLDGPRNVFAIDFQSFETDDAIRSHFPATYQHLYDNVRPSRIENRDARLRRYWWRFRRSNELYRAMLNGLERFIVTVETAKYRLFFFCDRNVLAEHGTISFGLNDPYFLGVMSSRIHITWTLATGGTLEDRPRYNKTVCFDPFPFPDADDAAKERIRALGEQLDAHRKRQQQLHPGLTMTGMYNVLEKLRAGEELSSKEKQIHEQGLVSVLLQIHDDLDAAVADAYGWPHDLTDEEILQRLVALNHERAAEERGGKIRWLRPEFQCPGGAGDRQTEIAIDKDEAPAKPPAAKRKKEPFPKTLPERIRAVRTALAEEAAAVQPAALAKRFSRAKKETVEELLETLVTVGQARRTDDGRYVA